MGWFSRHESSESESEDDELPDEWEEHKTDDGKRRVYYHNRLTRQSSWSRPAAPPPLPEGWERKRDAEGSYFYWHEANEQSVWERPMPLPRGWAEYRDEHGDTY